MGWYKMACKCSHPVKCNGCDQTVHISETEWMSKRTNPGSWRCSTCEASLSKAEIKRDRPVAREHMTKWYERNKSDR